MLPIDIMLPEFAEQCISWQAVLKLLCVTSFMVDFARIWVVRETVGVFVNDPKNRISVNSVIRCLTIDSVFMGQFSTLIAEIIVP